MQLYIIWNNKAYDDSMLLPDISDRVYNALVILIYNNMQLAQEQTSLVDECYHWSCCQTEQWTDDWDETDQAADYHQPEALQTPSNFQLSHLLQSDSSHTAICTSSTGGASNKGITSINKCNVTLSMADKHSLTQPKHITVNSLTQLYTAAVVTTSLM